jgi:hypothetical protein
MKQVFETVRKITGKYTAPLLVIKNKQGELITEQEKVVERWKEYCEELYEEKENEVDGVGVEEDLLQLEHMIQEPPPLRSEIVWALGKTANGKGCWFRWNNCGLVEG